MTATAAATAGRAGAARRRPNGVDASPDPTTLAEQSLLGALLLGAPVDAVADIAATDFAIPGHAEIFGAIVRAAAATGKTDLVATYEAMQSVGRIDDAGGLPYLNALAQNTPSAANIRRYAEIVRGNARRRRAAEAATTAAEALTRGDAEAARTALLRALDLGVATEAPALLDLRALAATEPQPPRFIVDGWLPEGQVTLFAGHGGSGKSLIALTAAICIASGRTFFGLRCERRRVLFLSFEDGADVLHWRLHRVCQMLGVDLASLAGWLSIYDATERGEPLFAETPREGHGPTPAFGWLRAQIAVNSAQVLVIDGSSDAFAGNENARTQVRGFIQGVRRLLPRDGAGLLLHHVDAASALGTSQKAFSGSTAWHNSARARWYLRPDDEADGSRVVLELRKSNHGKPGATLTLRFSESAHCFVPESEPVTSPLDRKLREADEREVVFEIVRRAEAASNPLPAATSGTRTAYSVASARSDCPDSFKGRGGRERFMRHLEALRQAGAIRVVTIRKANGHLREVLSVAT